jgi:uncharacterized protein (TIGR03492 family)
MKLLCLSNGHGEDIIALRILQELEAHSAQIELAALPIVGEGHAYTAHNIPLAGPAKPMPSGGFIYMDGGQQLMRDLKGGLLALTRAQIQTVRSRAKTGWAILAVGDIVPLLFAWWSGAPYAFVGTAKTEYYLRDERGLLPRRSWFEQLESWSGSVYLPWERWLMRHRRCRAVFPRDQLTANILQRYAIPAVYLGNPMMDGLEPIGIQFDQANSEQTDSEQTDSEQTESENAQPPLTFVLLPGSRPPEAYENWQIILQAVSALVSTGGKQRLLFLGAIAPNLALSPLQQALKASGWWFKESSDNRLVFEQLGATLILTQTYFGDCLAQADFAIAMTGTATEQFTGLGKPAITIPGKGPQFTPQFAEAQTRLLGSSVTLVEHPTAVVSAVQALLHNPDRLQIIVENGRNRMGEPGAARRISEYLLGQMADSTE